MSTKFGRNYYLTVQTPDGVIVTLQPPFTLELDITRNSLTSSNVCQLRIYNLSAKNRNLLRFNTYNFNLFNQLILEAGYGSNLTTIFSGNVSRAWSVREGVNFITQLECFDGAYAYVNASVDMSFPAGTPLVTVITGLIESLKPYNITLGAVGNFPGVLLRDNTYSGNAGTILFELTGGAFFIDNGKAYALKSDEYNPLYPVTLIDSSSGLINTPVLEETVIRFDMLFEPTLNIGTLVNLNSDTYAAANGIHSIIGVKHRGIISPVVSGDLITTGEFFYSGQSLAALEEAAEDIF